MPQTRRLAQSEREGDMARFLVRYAGVMAELTFAPFIPFINAPFPPTPPIKAPFLGANRKPTLAGATLKAANAYKSQRKEGASAKTTLEKMYKPNQCIQK